MITFYLFSNMITLSVNDVKLKLILCKYWYGKFAFFQLNIQNLFFSAFSEVAILLYLPFIFKWNLHWTRLNQDAQETFLLKQKNWWIQWSTTVPPQKQTQPLYSSVTGKSETNFIDTLTWGISDYRHRWRGGIKCFTWRDSFNCNN